MQGVGFRYFARWLASEEGVRGWVRNLPDGRVEAQAAGNPDSLAGFRDGLAAGPPGSRVDEVAEERMGSTPDWKSFEIVF